MAPEPGRALARPPGPSKLDRRPFGIRLVLAALAALTVVPATAQAQQRLGAHYEVSSTAYSACDSGTLTASGRTAFFGEVANNFLPLGTRIKMDRPIFGRRYFIVLDRIGWGSQLDVFMGCGQVNAYGRQERGFRVVRSG